MALITRFLSTALHSSGVPTMSKSCGRLENQVSSTSKTGLDALSRWTSTRASANAPYGTIRKWGDVMLRGVGVISIAAFTANLLKDRYNVSKLNNEYQKPIKEQKYTLKKIFKLEEKLADELIKNQPSALNNP